MEVAATKLGTTAYLQGLADAAQTIIEHATFHDEQSAQWALHYALRVRDAAMSKGVKPIENNVDLLKAAVARKPRCK